MDQTLDGEPGTFPCTNGVKVQGSTEERHDVHLLETVARAKQAGLKFNPDKCSIKKCQIEYLEMIISPQGVGRCPHYFTNGQAGVTNFLGTVAFMSTCIPIFQERLISCKDC